MYYIYLITDNINFKHYVGFTNNPKRRWSSHKQMAHKRPLYESMRKYGVENFTFKVIYEHEDRNHVLLEMEPYYINLYNSYNDGYNCTLGGEDTNSSEAKLKNSERMKKHNPMKSLRTNKGSFVKGHKPVITTERNDKIRKSKLGNNNHNYMNKNASFHLNNIKFKCEYCNKETNKGNYSRWHGNNCNLNPHKI